MKTNNIITIVSVSIGLLLIVSFCISPWADQIMSNQWYRGFEIVGVVLSFAANIAIGIVIYNYLTKVKLDIEGIGKVTVRRSEFDIQGLTNYLSFKLFDGDQFGRKNVLEAYYHDSTYNVEVSPTFHKPEKKRITVSKDGQSFSVERKDVKDVRLMIEITKCLLNDGKELDNATLESIYKQWYDI